MMMLLPEEGTTTGGALVESITPSRAKNISDAPPARLVIILFGWFSYIVVTVLVIFVSRL